MNTADQALPPLTDEEAQRIDMAMLQDKKARPGNPLVDGHEQRRQDRAMRLQMQDQTGVFE